MSVALTDRFSPLSPAQHRPGLYRPPPPAAARLPRGAHGDALHRPPLQDGAHQPEPAAARPQAPQAQERPPAHAGDGPVADPAARAAQVRPELAQLRHALPLREGEEEAGEAGWLPKYV